MSQQGFTSRLIACTDNITAAVDSAVQPLFTRVDRAVGTLNAVLDERTDIFITRVNAFLEPLFRMADRWQRAVVIGIAGLLFLGFLIFTLRFLRRLRRQVRTRRDSETAPIRMPLRQALSRWVFETVCNTLENIWSPFEGRPELWDRTLIRQAARNTAGKISRTLPFAARRNAGGSMRGDLLSLMDEGRGDPPQNLPEELVAALDASWEGELTLSDEWRSILSTVLERHRAGNYANLMIRGSTGSGKSMLIDWLEQHAGKAVLRLSPKSRDEAHSMCPQVTSPLNWPRDGMLILDNVEYFFERAPGGYSALEGILATSEQARDTALVWSCGNSFYRYAASLFPLEDLFPFSIDLDSPGAAHLATVYSRKLRAAGYQYSVIPDKQTFKRLMALKRRHAIAENDVSNWLKERFFETLSERGGSGYHFVSHYFMRAIRSIKDRTIRLRIRAPELFDLSFIRNWPIETLFILQSLYLHRTADCVTLARILALPEARVRIDLVRARERSIVLEEGGQYHINPLVHRVVWDILRRKNLFLPE